MVMEVPIAAVVVLVAFVTVHGSPFQAGDGTSRRRHARHVSGRRVVEPRRRAFRRTGRSVQVPESRPTRAIRPSVTSLAAASG